MGKTSIEGVTFMAVVVLVTTAFVFLLLPYYGAVLWATIVAFLFHPLHEWLCRWFGGRRNLAAVASVICFVCIVLIPGSIVLGSLADEATRLYGRISEREFAPSRFCSASAMPCPPLSSMLWALFRSAMWSRSSLAVPHRWDRPCRRSHRTR